MALDTFDEGIALGGLRSKREIKVLICYLFFSVKDKMSESIVTEAIVAHELANFFEVKAAFGELKNSENLAEDEIVDGEETYRLTENGKMVAEQLGSTLAYSVKAYAFYRVCFDLCNAYAGVFKIGQGTSYGIVLHLACDYVIAGLKHALKSQIYRVRRVEREDYASRIRYVKQRRESSSGIVYVSSSSAGLFGI